MTTSTDNAHLTVMVQKITRRGTTRNGNPVWSFVTDRATYSTEPDVSRAYEITGMEGPEVVRLELNEAGRVQSWTWLDPSHAHRND